ncbi:MAG: glycosyltransferase family 4 protein [Myxococcales bacterium FL481]|nr:MAG: glycosyltransferase family 4 protein [Myxococcales bacterium FL481]
MRYARVLVRRKLLLLPGTTFASHRLPIARAALEQGYELHVGAPAGSPRGSLQHERLHHHTLSLSRRPQGPRRELRAAVDVLSLLRRVRPDLVHLFTPRVIASAGPIVRLHPDTAVVGSITGLGYTFLYDGATASALRWAVSQAFRVAFAHPRSHVIVQNRDDLHELSIRHVVDAARTSLIAGSGVDTRRFTVPARRDTEPLTIVCASRLLWDKGVGEFVEAARMLRRRGTSARFALVGGPDRHNPRQVPRASLDRWASEGDVELWGHREDMSEVLRQADVFCLPSYREGMPRALLEAAACGCALVTTDAPGCRDFVVHGKHGLLVPPRDSVALADAIDQLIADKDQREMLGRAARAKVESGYTNEQVAQRVLAVYDSLLEAS